MIFSEFNEFSEKKIIATKMIIWTCSLFCKRLIRYHSASKPQVIDRIFELTLIHASVIYQIHRM